MGGGVEKSARKAASERAARQRGAGGKAPPRTPAMGLILHPQHPGHSPTRTSVASASSGSFSGSWGPGLVPLGVCCGQNGRSQLVAVPCVPIHPLRVPHMSPACPLCVPCVSPSCPAPSLCVPTSPTCPAPSLCVPHMCCSVPASPAPLLPPLPLLLHSTPTCTCVTPKAQVCVCVRASASARVHACTCKRVCAHQGESHPHTERRRVVPTGACGCPPCSLTPPKTPGPQPQEPPPTPPHLLGPIQRPHLQGLVLPQQRLLRLHRHRARALQLRRRQRPHRLGLAGVPASSGGTA